MVESVIQGVVVVATRGVVAPKRVSVADDNVRISKEGGIRRVYHITTQRVKLVNIMISEQGEI